MGRICHSFPEGHPSPQRDLYMKDHRAKPRGTGEEIKNLCGVQTSPSKQLEFQRPELSPGTSGFANGDLKTAKAQPFLAISQEHKAGPLRGAALNMAFPGPAPV